MNTKVTCSTYDQYVLSELRKLFSKPQNGDEDSISIHDVMMLLRKRYNNVNKLKNKHEQAIELELTKLYLNFFSLISWFNYGSNELIILLCPTGDTKNHIIYSFRKSNGDLYMVKEEKGPKYEEVFFSLAKKHLSELSSDIMPLVGNQLSDLYDLFMENKDFYTQNSYGIRSHNSGLSVDVDKNNISVFLDEIFRISLMNDSDKSNYKYKCNSNNVIESLKGAEAELFKRVFVKIHDCPDWIRSDLYERKNVLKKREKQLSFVKKVLPFIRKK